MVCRAERGRAPTFVNLSILLHGERRARWTSSWANATDEYVDL
jgi:hypothetical protein